MTAFLKRRRRALFAAAVFGALANPAAAQQSGTWTNPSGGSWNIGTNWLGGNIANGNGFTATFGNFDLAADVNVTLDGSRTIGNLIFNDPTPSNNWTVAPGAPANGVLTLASGPQPAIAVNNTTANVTLNLGGTQGMILSGNGTLNLTGNNSGLSGPIEIQVGSRLRVNNGGSGGSGTGSGSVTVKGGGTLGGGGTGGGSANVDGGVTVDAGGTIAPGNSAGTLKVGSAIISGAYEYELTGANYTPDTSGTGKSSDFNTSDLLTVGNGNLLILTVDGRVRPIVGAGTTLNPNESYSWTIGIVPSGSGTILINSPLAVDTSLSPFFANGDTRLSINGNHLNLNYTPVPEPTTVLGIAGLATLVGGFIRRLRLTLRSVL